MAADMQVERRRAGAQQVIVYSGDLEATFDQLEHHRIDLGLKQHEVAHGHSSSVCRLERYPAAKCQRRPDRDAVERHREIGAWKAITMHVTRHGGPPAKGVVDLLPVDFLCMCRRDEWFQKNLPVDFLRVRATGKRSCEN